MNTTTRRFSRTLAEAFPAERWASIEVHKDQRREWRMAAGFVAFLFCVLIGTHLVARCFGGQ